MTPAAGPESRASRHRRRCCAAAICCSSTRRASWIKTPPAGCWPLSMRPEPGSRWWGPAAAPRGRARGGVLELAHRWVHPDARVDLEIVHRFVHTVDGATVSDSEYARLSLAMRDGACSGCAARESNPQPAD